MKDTLGFLTGSIERSGVGIALALGLVCFVAVPTAGAQAANDEQAATYAEAGRTALNAGHYAEARENFEKLAKLQPNIAELHATLAAIYFKLREYELAIKEVRTAQRLKPSLPRLDSLLGLSLSELGEFEEALPRLEKGFKQSGDQEVKRMCGLQLLRAYTELGRDSDAVETALALNKLFPNDPEVLYHTGRIYGNYAYIVMEKLHDRAPNSVWMLQAQGEANEAQKDYDAAIIAFNHVLAMDPHRPGIHYRLGRVYLARLRDSQKPEDREAAQREFRAELEEDPRNGNAAYELANMAAEDNNLEEARKQFEAVIAQFPDFEQALVGLGGVYLQSQAGAQAVAPLERATKLDGDDEVAWYRLAQAQRAAGHPDEARKAMEKFRALHASSSAANKPPLANEVTPQRLDAGAQQ
jgi:tetratricopeptide (TPR) repeat protein